MLTRDLLPGLPTKRDPPEQLDLHWNNRSGAAHRCQILQTPLWAHEAPTGEDGAATPVPSTTSPWRNKAGAHEALIGKWHGCPTTLNGCGADALQH